MKYPMTLYLLFKLSSNNPPKGFLDEPYKEVISDIVDNGKGFDQTKQIALLSISTEYNQLKLDGYFENELLSVQGLIDELIDRELDKCQNAWEAYDNEQYN